MLGFTRVTFLLLFLLSSAYKFVVALEFVIYYLFLFFYFYFYFYFYVVSGTLTDILIDCSPFFCALPDPVPS